MPVDTLAASCGGSGRTRLTSTVGSQVEVSVKARSGLASSIPAAITATLWPLVKQKSRRY